MQIIYNMIFPTILFCFTQLHNNQYILYCIFRIIFNKVQNRLHNFTSLLENYSFLEFVVFLSNENLLDFRSFIGKKCQYSKQETT